MLRLMRRFVAVASPGDESAANPTVLSLHSDLQEAVQVSNDKAGRLDRNEYGRYVHMTTVSTST
jgi:hypothetical protein